MLALSGPHVGPCRPYVGLSWPYLAPMLVLCWPKFALCCPMLTLCWPQLPLSCPYVEPMFAYVGLRNANPIAVTEKAEVTTGWGRGGEGVATGSPQAGSAAGAALLYNLRLPTEGLRQGHGAGARICAHSHHPTEWHPVRRSNKSVYYPSKEESEYTAALVFTIAVAYRFWAIHQGFTKLRVSRLQPVECSGDRTTLASIACRHFSREGHD